MPVIPRRNYAQAHLDEVRNITGIHDWFGFLDRQDRLVHLMEISHPTMLHYDDEPADFSYYCTWDFLGRIEWYGLWINKTPQEDWLFREIDKRNDEWSDIGGVFNHQSNEALAILNRFQNLIGLARGESAIA